MLCSPTQEHRYHGNHDTESSSYNAGYDDDHDVLW